MLSISSIFLNFSHKFKFILLTLVPVCALQGTGRYSIYVANYASGNIGPHSLLEMDEDASDVTRGIVALSDVAAEAGVNKLTGEVLGWYNLRA